MKTKLLKRLKHEGYKRYCIKKSVDSYGFVAYDICKLNLLTHEYLSYHPYSILTSWANLEEKYAELKKICDKLRKEEFHALATEYLTRKGRYKKPKNKKRIWNESETIVY